MKLEYFSDAEPRNSAPLLRNGMETLGRAEPDTSPRTSWTCGCHWSRRQRTAGVGAGSCSIGGSANLLRGLDSGHLI